MSVTCNAFLLIFKVFGGNDFFNNVVAGDHFIARLSRQLRMGIALFYGPCFLPIPYTPRVTFCYGEPLPVMKWDVSKGPIPDDLINSMHEKVKNCSERSLSFTIILYCISISSRYGLLSTRTREQLVTPRPLLK